MRLRMFCIKQLCILIAGGGLCVTNSLSIAAERVPENKKSGAETTTVSNTSYLDLEYQAARERISSLAIADDLAGLERTADEIQVVWPKKDIKRYALLMIKVCGTFGGQLINKRTHPVLEQKYAMQALAIADNMPVDMEVSLVRFLFHDDREYDLGKLRDEDWVKARSDKANLLLHAWRRIEQETDRDFDFSKGIKLQAPLPPGVHLPPGIGPKAIKDPQLRAQYEASIKKNLEEAEYFMKQSDLRDLRKSFMPLAEQYLNDLYVTSPNDLAQLKQYLEFYVSDPASRERILSSVSKAIGAAKASQ